jgi:hypothetical protein
VVVGIAFAADPERADVERDAATLMRVAKPRIAVTFAKPCVTSGIAKVGMLSMNFEPLNPSPPD